MAEGKILFTDLFDEKLLSEIAKLRGEISGTLKDLQALKTTLPKTGNKTGDTEKLTAAQKERVRLEEKLRSLETQEYQNNEKLKNQIKERLAQKQAEGSAYKTLNKELSDNIKKYKDLAAAEKATTAEGKKLLQTIQEQDKKIKQIDQSVGQHQRNVGNYRSALGKLQGGLLNVVGALGLAGGLAGALEVAKGIMQSTEAGADKFAATMSGISSATGFLARSLATMDFSNLIQGFKDAYKAGVEYAESLDLEEDIRRAGELQKKDIDNRIILLRTEAKLQKTSNEVRKANLEEIKKLESDKLKIDIDIANAAVERELTNAESITGVNREMILDFIKNKGQYADAMNEAAAIEKKINNESISYVTDHRTGIMQTVQDYQAYKKAISELSPEMQRMIALVKLDNTLVGKKRDLVAAALTEQLDAQIAYNTSLESLVRVENRVESAQDKNFENEEKRSIERQQRINDEIDKLKELNENNDKFIQDWLESEDDFLKQENENSAKWVDQQMKITENNLKRYEDAAERLKDILDFEKESYIQNLQDKQDALDADYSLGLIKEKDYQTAKAKIKEEIEKTSLEATADTLGMAASLFEENTAAYKILASAQATINTLLTVTEIVKAWSGTGPWGYALGAAQAAIALAAGMQTVAKINGIKFEDGEIDIKGRRHSEGGIAAEIEGGESVINRTGTMRAKKTLELINQGKLSDNMILPALAMKAAGQMGGTVDNTNVVSEIKKTNELLSKFKFYSQDGKKVMDIHGNLVRYV